MTPNEYQVLSRQTLSPYTQQMPHERQVEVFATKLLGECVELMEGHLNISIELVDEMGDITWYLAMLCDAFNWEMEILEEYMRGSWEEKLIRSAGISPKDRYTSMLAFIHKAVIAAKNVSEHVVKRAAHGHSKPYDQALILASLLTIYSSLTCLCSCLKAFSMEEVLIRNVEKLQKDRYPNGFSAQVSEERY